MTVTSSETAKARAAQRMPRRQKDSTVVLALAGRATASKYAMPPSSNASKERFAARSSVLRRSMSRRSQIKLSSQVKKPSANYRPSSSSYVSMGGSVITRIVRGGRKHGEDVPQGL